MARPLKTFKEIMADCGKPSSVADPLQILGKNLRHLPPSCWQEHMLFFGAPDRLLALKSGGFAANSRRKKGRHPLFVLQRLGSAGFKVCPCTSQSSPEFAFICEGCRLEITGFVTDRNSYLVERYSFNLSGDPTFCGELTFKGVTPRMCIVLAQGKTRRNSSKGTCNASVG